MNKLYILVHAFTISIIVITDEQQVIHYKGNIDDLKSKITVKFVQVMNLLQRLCFDGCSGSTLEGMNVGSL